MDEGWSIFSGTGGFFYLGGRSTHLSAAGDMLDVLKRAESAVNTEADITEELQAALRRADIKSSRA